MRCIVTGDIHIKRESLEQDRKLLRHIFSIAHQTGCGIVILNGDVLDEKHGIGVEQLNMLYRELEKADKEGLTVWWVRGNHEVSMKSHPETSTIMPLFSRVCKVMLKPSIEIFHDAAFAVLPWYGPERYLEECKKLGEGMRQYYDKKRILITHVGVDEGRASASNMYVNQGVSLVNMLSQHYDLMLFSDYHHRQTLSDKALYLGIPISRAHGDDLDNGVWLLDTTLNQFGPLPFERGLFPQHRTWLVENPTHTALLGYSPQDHNRIQVPAGCEDVWRHLYPEANVTSYGSMVSDTRSRMQDCVDKSPAGVWSWFCADKSVDPGLAQLGKSLLDRVSHQLAKKGLQ